MFGFGISTSQNRHEPRSNRGISGHIGDGVSVTDGISGSSGSPNSGLGPAPGLRYPAIIRGTPLGLRLAIAPRAAIGVTNLPRIYSLSFQSLAAPRGSNPFHPFATLESEEIGGRRGATSSSGECQIVARDFVKTRVREGPQGRRVMRRRWRHAFGAIRTAAEPTTGRCAEAFPSPCQGCRHRRFDTWGSA